MIKNVLLIISTILIVGLLLSNYTLAKPHLWAKVSGAQVTLNGYSVSSSAVYRSWEGNILIRLDEKESSLYIFYPSRRLIGIPNSNAFIFLPRYAFSKDPSPAVVMSDNAVKVETDMNIVVDQNNIEFTTLGGGVRVKVKLHE